MESTVENGWLRVHDVDLKKISELMMLAREMGASYTETRKGMEDIHFRVLVEEEGVVKGIRMTEPELREELNRRLLAIHLSRLDSTSRK